MKTYLDLTAALNVQPRQSNSDSFANGKSFGEMIRMFEEHDPTELEGDPAFDDYDGIRRYINVWYKNASAEGLGVPLELDDEYKDEIQKYTVEKPEYEEDEETDLIDKIFGIDADG